MKRKVARMHISHNVALTIGRWDKLSERKWKLKLRPGRPERMWSWDWDTGPPGSYNTCLLVDRYSSGDLSNLRVQCSLRPQTSWFQWPGNW